MFTEAKGPSLKHARELDRDVHHLRIYGSADGSPESPRWIVEHHSTEHDKNPQTHYFENGNEMLAHVAQNAYVPEPSEEMEK